MESFNKLIEIIKILRSPNGCPWDREQNLYSLKNSMIEEASELLDALDNKDINNIREELGDLLLHIVFHSQIASEEGYFSIDDVVFGINNKLIRRHPHVFDKESIKTAEEVMVRWHQIKEEENKGKEKPKSILDKVPKNLPSVMQAEKLQKKAAKAGFDWDNVNCIFEKIEEELRELKEACNNENKENIQEEIGDFFFSVINLARHLKVDSDEAVRMCNKKFRNRFAFIEENLAKENKSINDTSIEEMDLLWNKAKKEGIK